MPSGDQLKGNSSGDYSSASREIDIIAFATLCASLFFSVARRDLFVPSRDLDGNGWR